MRNDYIKVVKFGGSSLADATQFKKVIDIIKSDNTRRYVVPSAPGKRFDGDFKVTDKLYECYNTAKEGGDFRAVLAVIRSRYEDIIQGLSLSLDLSGEFAKIEKTIEEGCDSDYVASRGEYLHNENGSPQARHGNHRPL